MHCVLTAESQLITRDEFECNYDKRCMNLLKGRSKSRLYGSFYVANSNDKMCKDGLMTGNEKYAIPNMQCNDCIFRFPGIGLCFVIVVLIDERLIRN